MYANIGYINVHILLYLDHIYINIIERHIWNHDNKMCSHPDCCSNHFVATHAFGSNTCGGFNFAKRWKFMTSLQSCLLWKKRKPQVTHKVSRKIITFFNDKILLITWKLIGEQFYPIQSQFFWFTFRWIF